MHIKSKRLGIECIAPPAVKQGDYRSSGIGHT